MRDFYKLVQGTKKHLEALLSEVLKTEIPSEPVNKSTSQFTFPNCNKTHEVLKFLSEVQSDDVVRLFKWKYFLIFHLRSSFMTTVSSKEKSLFENCRSMERGYQRKGPLNHCIKPS